MKTGKVLGGAGDEAKINVTNHKAKKLGQRMKPMLTYRKQEEEENACNNKVKHICKITYKYVFKLECKHISYHDYKPP